VARYLPDGTIDLIGRIDSQIKIRGCRIEPAEVEMALNRHPGVQESVVTDFQEANGEKSLAAYILPASDQLPSASELRLFLKAKLADYMIPSLFITLGKFPMTSSG